MGTEVKLDKRLGRRLVVLQGGVLLPCEEEYLAGLMIVVDGIQWRAFLKVFQDALVKKRRKFKEPFAPGPDSPEVAAELNVLGEQVQEIFAALFPSFKPIRYSYQALRPMITGPEPMHFDSYPTDTKVAAFVNVAQTPRIYNVGPSFRDLVKQQPAVMKQVIAECKGNLEDLSYLIRVRTVEGKPPMGPESPRHRVELAPGSVWFMDPKMVSHEVVYGEGASGHNWLMPPGSMPTQTDLVKGLM